MNDKNKFVILLKRLFALGGFVALVFGLLQKRKSIAKMTTSVEKEIKDAANEIEKNIKNTTKDVKKSLHKKFLNIAKDYIVPHVGNNHHPKALRPKALTMYVAIVLVVKIVVTGSLFFLYPNTGFVTSKITDELYTLTNQDRIENGLPPLIIDPELTAAAERKVADMVDKQYFAHIGPDGKKPWEWINKDNYNFVNMGENLAMDFSSAEVVNSAFMKSPTHRSNILHKEYTNIGMAIKVGEIDGRETIFLVQFFGKQKTSPTLAAASVAPDTSKKVEVAEEQPVVGTVQVPDEVVTEPNIDTTVNQPAVESDAINSTEPEVQVRQENIEQPKESTVPSVDTSTEILVEDTIDVDQEDLVVEDVMVRNETIATTTPTSTLVAKVDGITFSPSAQLVVVDQEGVQRGLVDLLVSWSRNFMTLMLIIVSMLFIVNVSVKARIQHSHVIAHSLLVIIFIMTMLFTRTHLLERFVV